MSFRGTDGDDLIDIVGNFVNLNYQFVSILSPAAALTVDAAGGSDRIVVRILTMQVEELSLNGGPGNDFVAVGLLGLFECEHASQFACIAETDCDLWLAGKLFVNLKSMARIRLWLCAGCTADG